MVRWLQSSPELNACLHSEIRLHCIYVVHCLCGVTHDEHGLQEETSHCPVIWNLH
jgi:hypothetical protein